MLNRDQQKLDCIMVFASTLATLSTCKRAQTSAVIFDNDKTRILSMGYNGQPRGSDNSGCTREEKRCGCIHAEANALVKLRSESSNLTMLSLTFPCIHCAGLIANCGQIGRVMWCHEYDEMPVSSEILKNAGVVCVRV